MYKGMSYADALKQLSAQREIFDGNIATYEQRLTNLAGQLEAKAAQLGQVVPERDLVLADRNALRQIVEQSAVLTRRAVGTLSDTPRVFQEYTERVAALNARDDVPPGTRRSLQAMEEANRIAGQGRPDYPKVPRFNIPPIPPDTTAPASLDYEVR